MCGLPKNNREEIVNKNCLKANLVLPDSNRCIPSFHKSLISMLLFVYKKYPFSSQIFFNEKFTRLTFPFKNLPLLQIIDDIHDIVSPYLLFHL